MEQLQARILSRENLQRLVTFRERIFDEDISFVSQLVLASAKLREPAAQMRDVWKGGAGVNRAAGTGFHTFHCFGEDLEALRLSIRAIYEQRNNSVPAPTPKPYEPPAEYWPEGDPK